jgi:hypothetical protein
LANSPESLREPNGNRDIPLSHRERGEHQPPRTYFLPGAQPSQSSGPLPARASLGCRGKVQHASGVTHLIVERVRDLSADLSRVSGVDDVFLLAVGRGDEAKHGGHGFDSREPKAPLPVNPRDMYEPDQHIDALKVKARNFRCNWGSVSV